MAPGSRRVARCRLAPDSRRVARSRVLLDFRRVARDDWTGHERQHQFDSKTTNGSHHVGTAPSKNMFVVRLAAELLCCGALISPHSSPCPSAQCRPALRRTAPMPHRPTSRVCCFILRCFPLFLVLRLPSFSASRFSPT